MQTRVGVHFEHLHHVGCAHLRRHLPRAFRNLYFVLAVYSSIGLDFNSQFQRYKEQPPEIALWRRQSSTS